jgi:hypothetical protein
LDKVTTKLFSSLWPRMKSDRPQHYVVRFNIGFNKAVIRGNRQLPIGIKHHWVDVIDGLDQPVEDRRRLQVSLVVGVSERLPLAPFCGTFQVEPEVALDLRVSGCSLRQSPPDQEGRHFEIVAISGNVRVGRHNRG